MERLWVIDEFLNLNLHLQSDTLLVADFVLSSENRVLDRILHGTQDICCIPSWVFYFLVCLGTLSIYHFPGTETV